MIFLATDYTDCKRYLDKKSMKIILICGKNNFNSTTFFKPEPLSLIKIF